MEFWKEREVDLQSDDFIDEINNKFDESNGATNRLEIAGFIELAEMSHPIPAPTEFIAFNIGEMMAREEIASERKCHRLGIL